MSKQEIKKILLAHQKWLTTEGKEGMKADLSGACLCHGDLRAADLYKDDPSNAEFCHADLRAADLREVGLRAADLYKDDPCRILSWRPTCSKPSRSKP